ncbi:MAG: GNAT family N-acetyltransferase [Chloroflexota bacterium]
MTQAPPSVSIPGLVLRPATRDDWDAIAAAMNRAHVADGVEEIQTGTELAAQLEPLESFRVERDMLLAEVDGGVVGFSCGMRVLRDGALVGEAWGSVVPESRRRGIGTALWRATRDRLAAEMAADPRPGVRELRSYALDNEPGAAALYADQGYVPIRFGFDMRRFLSGALPDHPLPAGLELRPVTPDQHRAIFDADDEAFRDHWGHRELDEGDFRARFEHPDLDTTLWCVAWDGDQVAGSVLNYIYTGENEELGIRRGWLEHVSVRRPWRGRGVAKALCAASFRVLRERGMDEAWLGVDAANPTGALRLYERLGFGVVHQWFAYGRPVDRVAPPGWRSAGDAAEGPA